MARRSPLVYDPSNPGDFEILLSALLGNIEPVQEELRRLRAELRKARIAEQLLTIHLNIIKRERKEVTMLSPVQILAQEINAVVKQRGIELGLTHEDRGAALTLSLRENRVDGLPKTKAA